MNDLQMRRKTQFDEVGDIVCIGNTCRVRSAGSCRVRNDWQSLRVNHVTIDALVNPVQALSMSSVACNNVQAFHFVLDLFCFSFMGRAA